MKEAKLPFLPVNVPPAKPLGGSNYLLAQLQGRASCFIVQNICYPSLGCPF